MSDSSNPTTTVVYDVSAAISSLQQLDDKVKGSGKTAQDAFDKAGASSGKFESGITGLTNQITSGAAQTAFYANQTLELANNLGTAAGRALELGQNIAEGGFGFESANKQIDEFIARLDSIGHIVQGAIDIGNAAQNAALERQLFLTSRSQLANERAQVQAIAGEQSALAIRLSANKQYYSELESISKQSAQKRKEAEDSLNSLVTSVNERRFLTSISRFNNNAQISKIIDQSHNLEAAGGKDNLASAENLLNDALKKAQDSGSKANVSRVEEGFNDLIKKRQDDANAAAKQADSDKLSADAAKKVTVEIEAQSAALKDNAAQLQATIQASALKRAEDKRKQQDNERNQAFDRAQLDLRKNLVDLDKIENQPISPASRIPNTAAGVIKEIAIPEQELDHQRQVLKEAQALQEQIDAHIKSNPTPAGIQAQAPAQAQLKSLLAELQDIPNLSATLVPDVDKLKKTEDIYERIQKAAEATAAASGRLDGGRPESVQPQPAQGTGNTGAGNATPAAPRVTNQNIQVDLQVRGGMIDSDTIAQITERVSREIRKGTVQA